MGEITDKNTEDFIFSIIENRGVCFESEIIDILVNTGLSSYLSNKFVDELPTKYVQIKIYNRNVIIFDTEKIERIKNKMLNLVQLNYPDTIMEIKKTYNILAHEENISNKLVKVLCSDLFTSKLKLIECINNYTGNSYCIAIPTNHYIEFKNLKNNIKIYINTKEILTQAEIINEFQISKKFSTILLERLVFNGVIGFRVQQRFDNINTNKIFSSKVFILPQSEILDSRRTRDEYIVMESVETILQEINLEYLYPTTYYIVKKSLELDLTYGALKSKEIIPSAIIIASNLHNTPITYEMINELIDDNGDFDLCSDAKCREKIREIKQKLRIPTKMNYISYIKQILNFMNVKIREKEIICNISSILLTNKKLRHSITGNNPWAAASALIYIIANNCKKFDKLFFISDYRQITIAYASKITEVSLRNLKNTIAKENSELIYQTIIDFYNENK